MTRLFLLLALAAPPDLIELGKVLFFDPRLSGDNTMSCATCHMPDKAFGDGLKTARGVGGKTLTRNTQAVLNPGVYTSYFWDGRAATLEEQALGPVANPDEMNQDVDALVAELSGVPGYVRLFRTATGGPVTKTGIAQALAAFQRTLVTRNSPFARFRAGDESALSEQAREGWGLFRDAGCARCHSGETFTDNKFHRLGVSLQDRGRGDYTFRTPSLLDVARTAPYMHDGSLATLEDVVQFYFRGTAPVFPDGLKSDFDPLVGRSFSEIAPIVSFLESLSGELPMVVPPALP